MMTTAKSVLGTMLIALSAAMPAVAATATSATVYPLENAQVALALSAVGINVDPGAVNLVAQVVAREPNAKLDVLDIRRTGMVRQNSDQTWVKLGCHDAGTCVPFYAVVKWSGPVSSIPARVLNSASHSSPLSPLAIHVGQRITLDIERDRSRIEIAVVSMENGAVGQTIRVSTPDRKLIYHAEVVNSALVKGAL